MIQVQCSNSLASYKGRFFRRVGKANCKMTGEEIKQWALLNGRSWDSVIECNASLDDLNSKTISQLVQMFSKRKQLILDNHEEHDLYRNTALFRLVFMEKFHLK